MDFSLHEQLAGQDAIISPDGVFRYRLMRQWEAADALYWVMLNPSVADASYDDPTIRKCMGFARHNGFGGIVVFNLFALRSTDPRVLHQFRHGAIGIDNDRYLSEIPKESTVVAGWGSMPYKHDWMDARIVAVRKILAGRDVNLMCVRKSEGFRVARPWHPLYVRYGPLIEL